jgi:hypothetical protein
MFFFLSTILSLVIGLPLLFFIAGEEQQYLDYGPTLSGVILLLLLMLDLLRQRRRRR